MSQQQQYQQQGGQPPVLPGPPYPPTVAALGGIPTKTVDVPIASVFLALFIGSAVCHMTIFQLNRRRGHKFFLSGMMFGYSVARSTAMIMRIVWACYPTDVQVAMASQIFVAAGVLLLFIINLMFAQRVIRAKFPKFGWNKAFSWVFKIIYLLIPLVLVMVIVTTVQSFYTLDTNIKRIDHDFLLGCQTYLLFVAFLPIPLVYFAATFRGSDSLEKFGTGRWGTKINVILSTSALLTLGAGWRVGTNFMPPAPIDTSPWYFNKACFWIMNFVIEIIVIYTFIFARVDQRFHVPDGSRQAGGYADAYTAEREKYPARGPADSDESLAIQKDEEDPAKPDDDFDKSFFSLPAPGEAHTAPSKNASFVSLPPTSGDVEAAASQSQNR